MATQTTVLRDIAMVMLNITIWSGTKKMEPSDFINVDLDDLPPARVASYGIKHLIDKARLTQFNHLRGKADRICSRHGTRLLGGFAIPQESIDIVGAELQALCLEFEQEIDAFMAIYDQSVEEWIASNPEFSEPLRRAVLPRATVRSRFRASFSIFEVSASPRDTTQSLAAVGDDLVDSLLNGFVQNIRPLIERKQGQQKESFRLEVRSTLSELAAKLRRFAFTDPSGAMRAFADRLSALVAGSGTIKGAEFIALWSFLSPLNSVDALRRAMATHVGMPADALAAPKPADLFNIPPAAPIVEDPIFDAHPFGDVGDLATAPAVFPTDAEELLPVRDKAEPDTLSALPDLNLVFDEEENPGQGADIFKTSEDQDLDLTFDW